MLVTIVSWIYIGIFCLLAGVAVRGILGHFFALKRRPEQISVTAVTVYGLIGITVYAEYFSIFWKVGAVCHLLLLAMVILYAIRSEWARQALRTFAARIKGLLFSWEGLFLLIVILAAAFYTSRGTFHTDTNIYHAQAIRIIEEYGVVKGIANLQLHFGYNSSYLVFCAFFTMSWLTGTALHTTTGFLIALFGCWACHGLKNFRRHSHHSADFMKLALLLYIMTNLTGAMSPATDYGTQYLMLYLFCAFLEAAEQRPSVRQNTIPPAGMGKAAASVQAERNKAAACNGNIDGSDSTEAEEERSNADADRLSSFADASKESHGKICNADAEEVRLSSFGMIAMGALFLVSMKLSAAAVFVIALYPMIRLLRRGEWKTVLKFVMVGVIVILPYLVRNVILTGWLFYPFEAIDLFDVEWKVPLAYSLVDSAQIKAWGRCLYDITLVDEPLSYWLPIWWEEQTHCAQMLIYANILSVPLFVCDAFLAEKRRKAARLSAAAADAASPAAHSVTPSENGAEEDAKDNALVPHAEPLQDGNLKSEGIAAPSSNGRSAERCSGIRWEMVNFIAMLYAGIAVWFFTAPFIRYGLAFLLAAPMLAVGLLLENLKSMESVRSFWKVPGVLLAVLSVTLFASWVDEYLTDDVVFIKQNLTEPYYITQKPFDYAELVEWDYGAFTVYFSGDGVVNSYYDYPSSCYYSMVIRTEPIGDTVKDGFRAIEAE